MAEVFDIPVCPKCKSDNYKYEGHDFIDGKHVSFTAYCEHCGCKFTELFKYVNTEICD